jgi:hypothetical protein
VKRTEENIFTLLLFNHRYFGILWSIFMETYIATVRCLCSELGFEVREKSSRRRTTRKRSFNLSKFPFRLCTLFFLSKVVSCENFASIYKNVLYTFISNSSLRSIIQWSFTYIVLWLQKISFLQLFRLIILNFILRKNEILKLFFLLS